MENRLSRKTKLFYGVAGIGDSALYSMMGTFALFFMTTVAGIDPAAAGAIVAVGAVWDVVSGSVVGYISDRTRSRMGRRRPFMLAAAFPLAVFCSLIFVVFNAPQAVRCAYYVAMFIAFWTGFSVFFVPYTAWGAELTDNYEERTELRGIVYIFYSVGAAVGTVLPTIIVDRLMQWGFSVETGWFSVGVLIGVVSASAIFISGWFVRDTEGLHAEDPDSDVPGDAPSRRSWRRGIAAAVDILRNYGQVLRFGPARYIILTSVFYLVSNSIFMADRMYFYTFNMELSANVISLIMLFQNVVSVLLVPALIKVNRTLDKRTLCIGGLGLQAACLILYGITGIPNLAHLLIFTFVYGIGTICYWQMIPSMLYDVCDADRLENGADRAGLIISFQGLTESVSEAIGFQILGLLLEFTGFNSELTAQNAATMHCIQASFTFVPAAFSLIAMFMMVKYPITRARHAEIIDRLS